MMSDPDKPDVTVLIADDDALSRRLLRNLLDVPGRTVIEAADGNQALEVLLGDDPPDIAVLDWVMPGMDGPDICRVIRRTERVRPVYVLLVTVRTDKTDVVHGLDSGADDYVTKPWNAAELRARVNVAMRVVSLQKELVQRVKELEDALAHVRRLQGILPICMYCKKIRDDEQYWHEVEQYITEHSEAMFSHSVCPDCYRKYLEPQLLEWERKDREKDAGESKSG